MANPSVVSFLFLLIVGAVHSNVILQEYKLKHIVRISSTNIGRTNKYSCKEICMDDSSCKALSTKIMENGKLKCDFSTEKPSEEELNNSPNSTTYVKNVCELPFKLIKDVGCIMLSEDIKNFDEATIACPKGSRLYSPATLGIFEHLRKHLLQLMEESGKLAINIFIGVKLNERSEKWELFNGGDVGDGEVGVYPFGGNDPDGGVLCARMKYVVNSESPYHLADVRCSKEYHYLCQVLM